MFLTSFDLELHHVPGMKLAMPDALSRHPDHNNESSDNEDTILLPDSMFIRLLDEDLCHTLATSDPLDNPVFSTAVDALNGICLPSMKSALTDWKIDEGLLFYKNRAYISPDHCRTILAQYHDHPTAGHPGYFKTEELVKCEAWWPGIGAFIRQYIDSCATCQQMKADTHPVTPPLIPISLSAT